MSDQGDLAKRWNAPSDDTNAYNPADDATGPMPAVEPADEDKPVPGWFEPVKADRAENADQAGSDATENWSADPWQPAPAAPPAPFEAEDERPPGKLVFPEAPAPGVEDEPSSGGGSPEPTASESTASESTAPESTASDSTAPDSTVPDSTVPKRLPKRRPASSDYSRADGTETDYSGSGYPADDYTATGNAGTGRADKGYAETDYTDPGFSDTGYTGTGYTDTDDAEKSADTGYAEKGYPEKGYAGTGYADSAYTGSAPTGGGYTDDPLSDPGFSGTGFPDPGYPDTGYADTAYSGTGRSGGGFTDSGFTDSGYPDPGFSDPGYSDPGFSDSGYASDGRHASGYGSERRSEAGTGLESGGPAPLPGDDRAGGRGAEAGTASSAPGAGGWEGSLFDGTADSEPGDGRYAPVVLPGADTPPKPGTPSSGNLRIPDWMREENGGGSPDLSDEDGKDKRDKKDRRRKKGKSRGRAGNQDGFADGDDDSRGGSHATLYAGVGLLVVALIVSAGVYFLKSKGGSDSEPSTPAPGAGGTAAGKQPQKPLPTPADRALRRFPGTPSNVIGRLIDTQAGLSYPRFGPPWQTPTRQNKLGQLGWSGQQVVVTEQRGTRLWYGQLLTGTLNPAEVSMYGGPGTEKAAAVAFANSIETRFYGFPHENEPFASQPLTVDGRKGWLISSYLRYRRPGVRATGELLITAVIDTGGKAPAVLFFGIPNTHRKLWADVSYFLSNMHLARGASTG